jgi:hypothetical protein
MLSVTNKPFLLSVVMFADKAGSLPKSGVPERCSTVTGSGLTRKYSPKLEKLYRNKHSSFL